jgi:hypothetical protein
VRGERRPDIEDESGQWHMQMPFIAAARKAEAAGNMGGTVDGRRFRNECSGFFCHPIHSKRECPILCL